MTKHSPIIATLSFALVASCGDDNNNNPPRIIPTASCLLAIPPSTYSPATPSSGGNTCPGYDSSSYPDEIRDWTTTETFGLGNSCSFYGCDTDGVPGCNGSTHFAWPSCSLVGVATGPAFRIETQQPGEGDGDYSFDICPEFQEVVPGDVLPLAMELRNQGAFIRPDDNETSNVGSNGYLGAMHIEVQDCLFYRGEYQTPNGSQVFDIPDPSDYMAAFGEWIADDGHHEFLDEVVGEHPEIHEATALALVKPYPIGDPNVYPVQFDPKTNLILASGFFTNRFIGADSMYLDVRTPQPSPAATSMISCERAADVVQVQPKCLQWPGSKAVPSVGQPGNICRINLTRDRDVVGVPALVDFGCWGATGQCHLDPFHIGGQCDPRIQFSGAFRATWDPPANLWLCECAAPDPSTGGASTIAVLSQGCSASTNVTTACADVCGQGGQVCDDQAEHACYLGDSEPGTSVSGQLVGPKSCDADAPANFRVHVSQNADYLADISGTVQITLEDHTITEPVSAHIYFDVLASGTAVQAIDMADITGTIPNFSIHGTDITNATLFVGARQVGVFDDVDDATHFRVPTGLGVYGLRANVDGNLQGLNLSNADGFDMSGHVDLAAKTFSLHIAGRDPKSGGRVVADADGSITNVPPHADASRTASTVECTSHTTTPITLDGTASSDPDGEAIAHYQWFRLDAGSPVSLGTGNTAIVQTSLPAGIPTSFQLHVYDSKLGANETTKQVTVVDTTPPTLDLSPQSFCLWPPNHQYACYRLGRDVTVAVSDICDPTPIVRVASVTSNQPTTGPMLGAGNTNQDAVWSAQEFCVRAERSATLGARVYTATIEAVDHSGNTTTELVHVTVPEDSSPGCR